MTSPEFDSDLEPTSGDSEVVRKQKQTIANYNYLKPKFRKIFWFSIGVMLLCAAFLFLFPWFVSLQS